jgi:PadR family transcriptional regulator, regulatory protein PadR
MLTRRVDGQLLRARFYRLTATGRKQLHAETRDWEQTAAIIARFFKVKTGELP